MSPTLLEITTGILAAILVFLFALRVVPVIIRQVTWYIKRTLTIDEADEREPHNDER